VSGNERVGAGFDDFAANAERRARATLETFDAELRRAFKLPASLRLPALEIAWEDQRPTEQQQQQPLPQRK
jgi:hypothetical protein